MNRIILNIIFVIVVIITMLLSDVYEIGEPAAMCIGVFTGQLMYAIDNIMGHKP